jgi:hypothetical protein
MPRVTDFAVLVCPAAEEVFELMTGGFPFCSELIIFRLELVPVLQEGRAELRRGAGQLRRPFIPEGAPQRGRVR